jgi:hypothetical protein
MILCAILIVVSAVAVAADVFGVSKQTPYYPDVRAIGIHPASGEVRLGKEFTVEVIANPRNPEFPDEDDMNGFLSFSFELTYDPEMLELISVENPIVPDYGIDVPGEMLPPIYDIDGRTPSGDVILSYKQIQTGFVPAFRNRLVALVEVTFLPLQMGTTRLAVQNAEILSPGSLQNAIDVERQEFAKITITPGDECIPNCTDKQCGSDGCGGSCGECAFGSECRHGQCILLRNCRNRNCGPDGAGGSCGECPEGQVCSSQGICVIHENLIATEATSNNFPYFIVGAIFVLILAAIVAGIIYLRKPIAV